MNKCTIILFVFQMSTCLLIWLLIFTLGLVKQSVTLSATATADEQTDATVVETDSLLSSFGDDLDKAESKADNKPKLEIIKQIRKLNSDGSYTVGYEAEDGTFKIESRDVLGNVKGTYGYVDVNGEIKRVSYTTNNGSSSSNSIGTTARPEEKEEVVQIPRQNKTGGFHSSTTRRPPSLAFLTTSQSTPTSRASVVQSIPKKRILLTASSERPTFNHYGSRHNDYTTTASPQQRKGGEPTTTVVYATSLPTGRPVVGSVQRPTTLPGTYKTAEQIARPDKLEITDHVSKVQISSNRDTSTSKPVTEEVDEKEVQAEEKRPRGNFVRRQLAQQDDHDEKFAAQQQVIYSQSAGDDSGYVPQPRAALFAHNSPRIPSVVLAARSRAALLQNVINGNAQKAAVTSAQPDKIYVKPPRRRIESSSAEDSEQSTEPSSENQYIAQRPGGDATVVQIVPANEQAATEEDKRVYRRPVTYPPPPPVYAGPNQSPPRHREFVRQAPPSDFDYGGPRQFRIPIPQAYPQQYPRGTYTEQSTTEEMDQQFLRETTSAAPKAYAAVGNEPGGEYAPQRPRGGRGYLPLPQQRGPPPNPSEAGYEQESLPVPFAQNPYSPYNRPPLPSQYYQNPDRPLTARDFERLLNLLVFRHQQLQQYGGGGGAFGNPFFGGGGGGGGFGAYGGPAGQFGYQQIPRPPLYNPYDPRYAGYNRIPYGEYSEQDALYQQSQQGGGGRGGPSAASDPQYPVQRNIARRQPVYQPQYSRGGGGEPGFYPEASQPIGQQQDPRQHQAEYLPSDIREELLYRMLLLAMQPGGGGGGGGNPIMDGGGDQQEASTPEYSTARQATTTTMKPSSSSPTKFRKPVRSVQIIGEE